MDSQSNEFFLQHIHISERRKLLVSLYKQLLYREKKKVLFCLFAKQHEIKNCNRNIFGFL